MNIRKVYALYPGGDSKAFEAATSSLHRQWFSPETGHPYLYVMVWPKSMDEVDGLESIPGLLLFPHLEDQMTTIGDLAAKLPADSGVKPGHNTFQAMTILSKHFGRKTLHPLR